jgi:hypothetical protein
MEDFEIEVRPASWKIWLKSVIGLTLGMSASPSPLWGRVGMGVASTIAHFRQ